MNIEIVVRRHLDRIKWECGFPRADFIDYIDDRGGAAYHVYARTWSAQVNATSEKDAIRRAVADHPQHVVIRSHGLDGRRGWTWRWQFPAKKGMQ